MEFTIVTSAGLVSKNSIGLFLFVPYLVLMLSSYKFYITWFWGFSFHWKVLHFFVIFCCFLGVSDCLCVCTNLFFSLFLFLIDGFAHICLYLRLKFLLLCLVIYWYFSLMIMENNEFICKLVHQNIVSLDFDDYMLVILYIIFLLLWNKYLILKEICEGEEQEFLFFLFSFLGNMYIVLIVIYLLAF